MIILNNGGGRMKGFIEVELDMTVTTKKLDLNIDGINAYEYYTIYLKHEIVLYQKISNKFVTYKYLLVKETREEIKKKIKEAQEQK